MYPKDAVSSVSDGPHPSLRDQAATSREHAHAAVQEEELEGEREPTTGPS